MELKNIFENLKPYFLFISVLGLTGALVGYKSAAFFPQGYRESQLFFVKEAQLSDSQDSQNAYFRQEKAGNFTDSAVAIIQNENFENVDFGDKISVTARKLAPQVIRITVQAADKENLEGSLQKVTAALNSKIEELSKSQASQIEPIFNPESISFFALNNFVLATSGAILGLLSSIIIVGLKSYFKV